MRGLKHSVIAVSFVLGCFTALGKGHNISFKIKNSKEGDAILGHYLGTALVPDDTVKANAKGEGRFKGERSYPAGMYFIVSSRKKIDFFIDDDQKFVIETDASDLFKNLSFKGSKINKDFLAYRREFQHLSDKNKRLAKEKKKASGDKLSEIQKEITEVFEDFKSLQDRYIESNKDNVMGTFLRATKDVEVPPAPKDENGKVIDKNFRYNYYKNHYFDHIDLASPALLRTNIYEEKLKKYVEKVVSKSPESLIETIDILVGKSRKNKETFKYVLNYLLSHTEQRRKKYMGFDAVLIHLADRYYIPEADWASKELIGKLEKLVRNKKHILIGNNLPSFELIEVAAEHFINAVSQPELIKDLHFGTAFNSHDIDTDYVIFYFWDPDCSKCRRSAPMLHNALESFKTLNTTLVGVNLVNGLDGKKKWVDFVNKYELYDWINAWHPFNHRYKRLMDLRTTNQVFVIDKDKKIIAKDIHPTRLEEFIKNYSKRHR